MNVPDKSKMIGQSVIRDFYSGNPVFECNASLVLKDTNKEVGLYVLTDESCFVQDGDNKDQKGIYYVEDGTDKMKTIPLREMGNLRASKPGAKQIKLRVIRMWRTRQGDTKEVPFTFLFPGPSTQAQELMFKFRDLLVSLMFQMLPQEEKQRHFEQLTIVQKQRLTALNADDTLQRLHQQLVGSGTLTDDEFWSEHRDAFPQPTDSYQLQYGISPSSLKVIPDSTASNTISITFTPHVISSIFRMYPSVKAMYAQTVPNKYKPEVFWMKYLQSQRVHERNAHLKGGQTKISNPKEDIFVRALQEEQQHYQTKLLAMNNDIENVYDLRSEKLDEYYGDDQVENVNSQLSLFSKVNSASSRFMDISEERMPDTVPQKYTSSNEQVHKDSGGRLPPRKPSCDRITSTTQTASHVTKIGMHYRKMTELDDLNEHVAPESKRLLIDSGERYFQAFASKDMEGYSKSKRENERELFSSFDHCLSEWVPHLDTASAATAPTNVVSQITDIIRSYQSGPAQAIAGSVDDVLVEYKQSIQELLRHYWSCTPCATAASAKKATKVIARLLEMRNLFDAELAKRDNTVRQVFTSLKESIKLAEINFEEAKQESDCL